MTERKKTKEEYIYCAVVGGLYLYAVNASILASTIVEAPPAAVYLTGLFFLAAFAAVLSNRKVMYAACGALLLLLLYAFLARERLQRQWEYLNDLMMLTRGFVAYRDEFETAVIRLICGSTALLTAFFMFWRFNFYALAFGGAFTFALSWIMDYRRSDAAFAVFLLCFFLLLLRKNNVNLNRENKGVWPALFALPVCAAVVFAAGRLPGTDASAGGQAIRALLDRPLDLVNEFFYVMFNPKYFSLETTGFAGADDNLGGPVAMSERNAMLAEAPGRAYLNGAAKNSYTGRAWEDTIREGSLYPPGADAGTFDFLETAAALIRYTTFYYPGDDLFTSESEPLAGFFSPFDVPYLDTRMFPRYGDYLSYLPVDTINVQVGSNRTGTVFRPQKARNFSFNYSVRDYSNMLIKAPSGDIKTRRLMSGGTVYSFLVLNPDTNRSFVRDILYNARRGLYAGGNPRPAAAQSAYAPGYDEFNKMYGAYVYLVRGQPVSGVNDYGENYGEYDIQALIGALDAFERGALAEYADNVYKYMLELPDSLPGRVYELAREITEGCRTDYERALAIEQYLLRYAYTLDPEPLPPDADFVDYFLFEGKEGYCTYFASAFAVLCRCAGIPSRYNEGYILPPSADMSIAYAAGIDYLPYLYSGRPNGLYRVTNKQAHAWAEVYLEGYGWLLIEATPPYSYVAQGRPGAAAGMFAESFAGNPNYREHLQSIGFDDQTLKAAEESIPAATSEQRLRKRVRNAAVTGIAILAVAVVLLAYLSVQQIREWRRWRKVGRMPVNERAQAYYKGIIKMTEYYHYPMKGAETPRMYGARLGMRFAFKSDSVFLRDLIALYYKAKYGAAPLTEKEVGLMRDCYKEMVVYLRNVRRWPRFMFIRYVRRVTVL